MSATHSSCSGSEAVTLAGCRRNLGRHSIRSCGSVTPPAVPALASTARWTFSPSRDAHGTAAALPCSCHGQVAGGARRRQRAGGRAQDSSARAAWHWIPKPAPRPLVAAVRSRRSTPPSCWTWARGCSLSSPPCTASCRPSCLPRCGAAAPCNAARVQPVGGGCMHARAAAPGQRVPALALRTYERNSKGLTHHLACDAATHQHPLP